MAETTAGPLLTGNTAAFVAARRVGRLATSSATGKPHIVPVCYAWDGSEIWIPLDAKPKQGADLLQLRRVRNIQQQPQVALIIDDYLTDNWEQLAYVMIDGIARIVLPDDPAHRAAVALLRTRYVPYQAMPIDATPAIAIQPSHVVTWGAVAARAMRPAALEASLTGRRSVRHFGETPVTRQQIARILEAARWAPSPHGRQPWRFQVVTQSASKERLALAMGEDWETTLAQDGEPAAIVAQRLANSRQRIRTAPTLIIPCLYLEDLDHYPDAARQQAETTMALQSLGAAIQNMLLLAYHEGLDMGWMCAPLFCQATVQRALDLPASWLPQALLPLGYATSEPKRRPRRPLGDLVRWDA